LITGEAIKQKSCTIASASSLYSKDFTTPETPTPHSPTETTQWCSKKLGKNPILISPSSKITHQKDLYSASGIKGFHISGIGACNYTSNVKMTFSSFQEITHI